MSSKGRPEFVGLEDGRHKGRITDWETKEVTTRTGGKTQYRVFVIAVENSEVTLRFSAPDKIGVSKATKKPTTKLARFLFAIGHDITREIDYDRLKGKKISFTVANEETERGVFARIVEKTVTTA